MELQHILTNMLFVIGAWIVVMLLLFFTQSWWNDNNPGGSAFNGNGPYNPVDW